MVVVVAVPCGFFGEEGGMIIIVTTTREDDIHHPRLPDRFLVGFGYEPAAFSTLLFEELDEDLVVAGRVGMMMWGGWVTTVVGVVELADEGVEAVFEEGFQFGVGDVGEGGVEDVVGCGVEGVEEAVEEDGVDDAFWGGGGVG